MPAAVLVHVVNRIIFPPEGICMSLREIVEEARDTMDRIFDGEPYLSALVRIIEYELTASQSL